MLFGVLVLTVVYALIGGAGQQIVFGGLLSIGGRPAYSPAKLGINNLETSVILSDV